MRRGGSIDMEGWGYILLSQLLLEGKSRDVGEDEKVE